MVAFYVSISKPLRYQSITIWLTSRCFSVVCKILCHAFRGLNKTHVVWNSSKDHISLHNGLPIPSHTTSLKILLALCQVEWMKMHRMSNSIM